MQYLSYCDWLISPSICPQGSSILLHMAEFSSFLRLINISLYYILHFLYLGYINGHLSGFCILAIVKNAAMNIGV